MNILDRMIADAGCDHWDDHTTTDTNGDPCCPDCATEWADAAYADTH